MKLFDDFTENLMHYVYDIADDDVSYNEDAERLLALLDNIGDIESATGLYDVCDSLRSDVVDVARGDNVDCAFGLQSALTTIKDLRAAEVVITTTADVRKKYLHGLFTSDELHQQIHDIIMDTIHADVKVYGNLHIFGWEEVWYMTHLRKEE